MVPENDDTETTIEEKTDGVTVDPDDVETPNDGPPKTEAERADRKKRRQDKLRGETEARAAAEARERAANERTERLERELAETRGYVAALGQRQTQNDPAAERKARIDALEAESYRHLQNSGMAQQAKDPERAAAEMRAYNAKQREIARLEVRAEMEPEFDRRLGEFRQQQQAPLTADHLNIREKLVENYSWLRTNRHALNAVDAEVGRRTGGDTRKLTYELIAAVCAEVQRDLGLKVSNPPTERSRQAYVAPGGGESGGGGGEGGSITVKMGKAEKTMAHKLYPDLDPSEAEKRWAREVGAPEARRQARG